MNRLKEFTRIKSRFFARYKHLSRTIIYNLCLLMRNKSKNNKCALELAIYNTALDSDNCGDQIIMEACRKHLKMKSGTPEFSTHRVLSLRERKEIAKCRVKVLCGTNILSCNVIDYSNWKINPNINIYSNTILMGAGFLHRDEESCSLYTTELYKAILSKEYLHSVRDRYSERMLKSIGIQNVIYTSCPTLWNITPELCKSIPKTKRMNVVTTITYHKRDVETDRMMLNILFRKYEKVYLWLQQGEGDMNYVKELGFAEKVVVIQNNLKSFDEVLDTADVDYVGTRLHGGIRAIQHGCRSIIISVDNRAIDMAEGTNLPILLRKDIKSKLAEKIDSEFETNIMLPMNNIIKWKEQFK